MRHAAAILLLVTSLAHSQIPSPTPGEGGDQPQPKARETTRNPEAANDQTNSSSFALTFDNPITIEKTERDRQADAEENEHKASRERWLVGWTAALAIFTFFLTAITGVLARFTYKLWEDAQSVHRPRIRIKHVWLSGDIWEAENVAVNIAIVNCGDAKAVIREFNAAIRFQDAGSDLPPVPFYASPPMCPVDPVLVPGITLAFPAIPQRLKSLAHVDAGEVRTGRKTLYCHGFVEYSDKSGIRTTAFVRTLRMPPGDITWDFSDNGRFVAFPDPDYEYQD